MMNTLKPDRLCLNSSCHIFFLQQMHLGFCVQDIQIWCSCPVLSCPVCLCMCVCTLQVSEGGPSHYVPAPAELGPREDTWSCGRAVHSSV